MRTPVGCATHAQCYGLIIFHDSSASRRNVIATPSRTVVQKIAEANMFLTSSTRQYHSVLASSAKCLRSNTVALGKPTEADVSATANGDRTIGKNGNALPLTDKDTLGISQDLLAYLAAHTREEAILAELRAETAGMRGSTLQVSPAQGQFLSLLVRLIGATRCIEVGVFTGYSALSVAMALPDSPSACLIACDRCTDTLAVARRYFERAGVSRKVQVREGMAFESLQGLLDEGQDGSFDFAFLDADKRSYYGYFKLLMRLLRPGGLLVVDNVLWHGKVADHQVTDVKTESLREFNKLLMVDSSIDFTIVPLGDGMALCRKK